ncbi:FAD/FMN-containing isoamyl alcohol oxidase MreA [Astrocystis sublimbata]|nr:FAD/FMN-containing isoamyl alcohol oxidase MreA [Astrocystis sublimbata]
MGLLRFLIGVPALVAAIVSANDIPRDTLKLHSGIESRAANSSQCRCFPGDACWPSKPVWDAFNKTIDGKLIATVPLAAPCHDSKFARYNLVECTNLQHAWFTPELHIMSPTSIMAPFFANDSCSAFRPRSSPCVKGTYASYSVNVSQPMDVARTLWFATYFNIRVVVKNTGHDYNGKSTGAGAIGIWTHNLKHIRIADYTSANYTGKAIRVGAGVEVQEAYAVASANGLAIVGGECPTVGYAGGYTQGGGHSALSSTYGLAADQVLEWEVVDGRGRLLKATPTKNSDLYWALSGGGGGTYGVVTSMTSKAYPDIPVTGATFSFTKTAMSRDQFYNVAETYIKTLPAIVDAGAVTVSFLSNTTLAIAPLTAPGSTPEKVTQLLQPIMDQLTSYNVSFTQSDCPDVGTGLLGGRMIPREVAERNTTQLVAAYRDIAESGGVVGIIGLKVSRSVAGDPWNAVNVAWRDTLIQTAVQTGSIEDNQQAQNQITSDFLPLLEELTPGGSAYLNEGDFQQPDWQQVFYGSNYKSLRKIKDIYDPFHLFYAITAVGSEYWKVQENGQLCRS